MERPLPELPNPHLQALATAVERFCATSGTRSPQQAAADLVVLRGFIDRLELSFSILAAVFAGSDEHESDGSAGPVTWLRNHCKMGSGAAADRVCVGSLLPHLADSVEALDDGEIGYAHFALIARTVERVTTEKAPSEVDTGRLLALARSQNLTQFRRSCDHFRHSEDPEGFARDEKNIHGLRYVHLQPNSDGSFGFRGLLDATGGATLRTALESLSRRQGADDARSQDQRSADALVDLASYSLTQGQLPRRGGQRPHLVVTASLETLLGMVGAPAADVELGLPISAKAVERIACDCSVTRVLLGADSAIIDLGREKRVISPALRRALNVRDRGCIWPGGNRSTWNCDGHHLKHWLHGGETVEGNTALMCRLFRARNKRHYAAFGFMPRWAQSELERTTERGIIAAD